MRKWPGWDGAILLVAGLAALVVYLQRGGLGGELELAIVLLVDLLYLSGSWWLRRAP